MIISRRRAFLLSGAAAAGVLSRPAVLRAQQMRTLADTLAADSRFSQFLDVVTRAAAIDEFRQSDSRMVFAPTNKGMSTIPPTFLERSGSGENSPNAQRLRPLVLNHIVQGTLVSAEVVNGKQRVRTLGGKELEITANSGSPTSVMVVTPAAPVGGNSPGLHVPATPITFAGPMIPATNGTIYPIDGVLVP